MAARRFSVSLLALAASLGGLPAVAAPAPQQPPTVPSAREKSRTFMSNLTNKIETYVPDPSVVMVLAKVMGSRFKPNGDGTESGVVTFKVLDLYRGPAPQPGAIFEISGTRGADALSRPMDGRNQWNALAFAMNDELLLALHPTDNPRLFTALAVAGSAVHGADLKEALAIESTPVAHRLARLGFAVQSESHLLQNYAFAALRVPGVATREQGALALAHAFEATNVETVRYGLFAEMETPPYADMQQGPDAANRAILSGWLKAILHEQNAERRASFLNHFAARLGSKLSEDPSKDRDLRRKIAAAIQDPPKSEVAAMLDAAASANPSDVRFKRLAEAWAH
jgi:hypothetical protein